MKIDGYDSYGRSDSDKALFASSSTLVIAIVALFIFMAAVMAGVVLTNLTNTYILQKKRELTIMRINGFTVREVIGYVTRETVFTTVVGTVLGIAMGAVIAYRITRSLETAFVQYNRSVCLPAWVLRRGDHGVLYDRHQRHRPAPGQAPEAHGYGMMAAHPIFCSTGW